MRKIILLAILYTTAANAGHISCSQTTGWETQGMVVKAVLSADSSMHISDQKVQLSALNLNYQILSPDEGYYEWSKGAVKNKTLTNDESYNPRKYAKHMKFHLSVNGDQNNEGWGLIDIIIPKKNLSQESNETFKSFLIMTWMDDHFGGTVELNCTNK